MVKGKKQAQDLRKRTLQQKFGAKTATEIINRRKLNISRFDRVTDGLSETDIASIEKKKLSAKGRRVAAEHEFKRKENPKMALFCKGTKSSEEMNTILHRLSLFRGCNATRELTKKKADCRPFEDRTYMMKLMHARHAHLMIMGSHQKKRPNNLMISRRYGPDLLDMAEFGSSIVADHKIPNEALHASKAVVITQGALWHGRYEMNTIKSLLMDLFYGYVPDKIFMTGIQRAVVLTALPNPSGNPTDIPVIHVKQFVISWTGGVSSDEGVADAPIPVLAPCDIELNLTLRRIHVAEERTMNTALRIPREEHTETSKTVQRKNVSKDEFGNLVGRVYLRKDPK